MNKETAAQDTTESREHLDHRLYRNDDLGIFAFLPFDAIVAEVKSHRCDHFEVPFRRQAEQHAQKSETAQRDAYHFVATLCGVTENFDDNAEPYKPAWSSGDRRSPVPDDLFPSDVTALAEVVKHIQALPLVARLNDILWLSSSPKPPDAARRASAAYLKLATETLKDEPPLASDMLRRGLFLARRLGKDSQIYLDGCAALIEAAKAACEGTEDFSASFLLQLLLDTQAGDSADFAARAQATGRRLENLKAFDAAQRYFELESTFWRRAKVAEAAQAARRSAANALVHNAEYMSAKGGPGNLLASQYLARAIKALSQAREAPERIAQLTAQQAEYQRASMSAFTPMRLPVTFQEQDRQLLDDIAERSAESVKGRPLSDALAHLAFDHPLANVEAIKNEVLAQARSSPLASLFPPVHTDHEGRVVATSPSLRGDGDDSPDVVEQHCLEHAREWFWRYRACAIESARVQVVSDHFPGLSDLAFLVSDNPWIRPGHERICLKGIHAGLHNDFVVASHLLVPQIEATIRHLLSDTGETIVQMADGTQEYRTLGALLDLPVFARRFSSTLRFELRGVLIQNKNAGFRHALAHGFALDGDCHGLSGITAWWLMLRLLILPFLVAEGAADMLDEVSGATQ